MTDEEIRAGLARDRADPAIAAVVAKAPKDLSPGEAARIARLLWPRACGSPVSSVHEKTGLPAA
jgi:hypothetical protein